MFDILHQNSSFICGHMLFYQLFIHFILYLFPAHSPFHEKKHNNFQGNACRRERDDRTDGRADRRVMRHANSSTCSAVALAPALPIHLNKTFDLPRDVPRLHAGPARGVALAMSHALGAGTGIRISASPMSSLKKDTIFVHGPYTREPVIQHCPQTSINTNLKRSANIFV